MRRALALVLALCAAAPALAGTEVYIKVGGQGATGALPLAVPPFIAADATKPQEALLAARLHDIVRDDLLFSRYFNLLENGPHYDGANLAAIAPDWKTGGANWILGVKAAQDASLDEITVDLFDVGTGSSLFERYYKLDDHYERTLAHTISDDVVRALTGKKGVAHTRIAFVNDQTGDKELYLVDYDGARVRQLTRDRSIDLLPRFSPDRTRIAYTSYKDGNPDLFLLDVAKGVISPLSTYQGLNIAGGFSPNGSELLMTLSRGKSPNIYLKNLLDGTISQLTQQHGADSSPTFSPDGQQVAFTSDRAGNPEIYIMNMTTRRVRRLTNLAWCDSPSWSPTGEWIAFAGRANPQDPLDIFLVDVTGNQIRRLTNGEGANENPSWSPDGRFLVFTSTRDGAGSKLFVMDADGSAPRRLLHIPGSSITPAWSD